MKGNKTVFKQTTDDERPQLYQDGLLFTTMYVCNMYIDGMYVYDILIAFLIMLVCLSESSLFLGL